MAGLMDLFEGGINGPMFGLGVGLMQGANPGQTFASGMQQGFNNMGTAQAAYERSQAAKLKLEEAQRQKQARQSFIESQPFGTPGMEAQRMPYQQTEAEMFPGEAPVPGLMDELGAQAPTGLYASAPQQAALMDQMLQYDPDTVASELIKSQFTTPKAGTSDMQNYQAMLNLGYTPAEAAKYTFEAGSGTNITLPPTPEAKLPNVYMGQDENGNPVMRIGGEELGRGATTASQSEAITNMATLDDLNQMKRQFKKEYLTWPGQAKALWSRAKSKAGRDLDPEETEYLKEFTGFKTQTIGALNAYIKSITGAAMSESEAARIKSAFPNEDDSPEEFESKVFEIYNDIARAQTRHFLIQEGGLKDTIDYGNVTGLKTGLQDVWDKRINDYMEYGNYTRDDAEARAYKELKQYVDVLR